MCHVSCVMCHVSRVTCHVSRVTCHVSHVTCHVSQLFFVFVFLSFFFIEKKLKKWWSLSVEGLLSTGPTPSSYNDMAKMPDPSTGTNPFHVNIYIYLVQPNKRYCRCISITKNLLFLLLALLFQLYRDIPVWDAVREGRNFALCVGKKSSAEAKAACEDDISRMSFGLWL